MAVAVKVNVKGHTLPPGNSNGNIMAWGLNLRAIDHYRKEQQGSWVNQIRDRDPTVLSFYFIITAYVCIVDLTAIAYSSQSKG